MMLFITPTELEVLISNYMYTLIEAILKAKLMIRLPKISTSYANPYLLHNMSRPSSETIFTEMEDQEWEERYLKVSDFVEYLATSINRKHIDQSTKEM
jgi:hypothetical protein